MEQRGVISDDKGLELAWELSDDGELTITGEGRIPDCYTRRRPGAPWDSVSSGIKSVTVGEGITAIGCRAFRGYPALTRITLPGTLTTIASEAFFYCPIEEVILPPAAWLVHRDGADPAEYLEAFRKWNRNNMHQNAPEQEGQEKEPQLIRFGQHAFTGSPWAKEKFGDFIINNGTLIDVLTEADGPAVPQGVDIIGSMAFAGLKVTSVELPEGLKEIEPLSFERTGLKKIVIPLSVSKIGNKAFEGCADLTVADIRGIGEKICEVADDAFAGSGLPQGDESEQYPGYYILDNVKEEGMRDCKRLSVTDRGAGFIIGDEWISSWVKRRITSRWMVSGVIYDSKEKKLIGAVSYTAKMVDAEPAKAAGADTGFADPDGMKADAPAVIFAGDEPAAAEDDGRKEKTVKKRQKKVFIRGTVPASVVNDPTTIDLARSEDVTVADIVKSFHGGQLHADDKGRLSIEMEDGSLVDWYTFGKNDSFAGMTEEAMMKQWLANHTDYHV